MKITNKEYNKILNCCIFRNDMKFYRIDFISILYFVYAYDSYKKEGYPLLFSLV